MAAEVIETQGRAYPIDMRYRPPTRRHIAEDVADCVRESLAKDQGDILVFLPGAADIERARRALCPLSAGVSLHILHGDLSAEAQDRALRPDPAGGRKIILSTAIAETSLTIEGVKVVIDSGLMRVARFDQNSGMDRLETVTVTLSSATQRAGRAGRLGPGICYRLWPEAETRGLLAQAAPELLEADLSPLALELAQWGAKDATKLSFLNPPPAAHFAAASDLLHSLELIDAQGAITDHGRACGSMGLHPRLSHMIIKGRARGLGSMAAYLAALLSDRDPLRGAGADAVLRLEALMGGQASKHLGDSASLARIARLAKTWIPRGSSDHKGAIDPLDVGTLIALAYPDRVAAKRGGSQTSFRLVNGRGAEIDSLDSLARLDFLAIADLDGPARGAKIRLAAPLSLERIEDLFGPSIETRRTCEWDSRQEAVTSRIQRRLGQLVLEDRPDQAADPEDLRAAMIAGIRAMGLAALPWEPRATQLVARARLAAHHAPDADVPDLSEPALISGLEDWLGPDLEGRTRRTHLKDIDLAQALKRLFTYGQMRALDRLAPIDWQAPTGSTITLDYAQGDLPVLAVRLQEVFGLSDTPRICDGRLGVLLHLLSPAHRPVQVTADLAGFWRGSYMAVRADLRGRYPKHAWPDDPASATPLRGTKKRG
jgi:ATP-dependent helicase HrpB